MMDACTRAKHDRHQRLPNDYLIDKYDINRTLTYESEPKKYQIQQWLHFQSSGQGPYFRQAVWCVSHPPSNVTWKTPYDATQVHYRPTLRSCRLLKPAIGTR